MNIEEIRNSISALNRQIETVRSANAMNAMSAEPDMKALREGMNRIEDLKTQRSVFEDMLSDETEKQSRTLKAVRQMDSVKKAGEAFKSMGDFMTAVADYDRGRRGDTRMSEYLRVCDSASGSNVGTDADGGYLVPPEYAEGLLDVAQTTSALYPEVSKVPVTGNRLLVNELDVASLKDGSDTVGSVVKGRHGGLIAYWKAEAAEYAATKLHFKQTATELEKLTGLTYATEEMLQDAPALAGYISEEFQKEFAFQIDNAILNGTGNGMPLGILAQSETAAQNNAALVVVAKESGQAAATIVLNNILKMFNAMPAANRANAKWYINQDVEIVLMQLLMQTGTIASTGASAVEDIAGTFGVPLYVPAGGLASAPNGMLLGRPIVPIDHAAALGSLGDIAFIDPSQYRWIDKGGVNAQASLHVRFIYDETAFKFTYRAGGRPIWSNTVEAYKGTTKRSPYVTLAARA